MKIQGQSAQKLAALNIGWDITNAGKGKSVCLVSNSSARWPFSADQIARRLVEDGWHVTLADLSPFAVAAKAGVSGANSHTEVHKKLLKSNPAPDPAFVPDFGPAPTSVPLPYTCVPMKDIFQANNDYTPLQSLCVYHWLNQHNFDLIIFQHGFGAGHYSTRARRLGSAFQKTPIVVMADDPLFWWYDHGHYFSPNIRTDMEIDYFERETLASADAVITSNPDGLDWMTAAGWTLPAGEHCAAIVTKKYTSSWGEWLAEIIKKSKPPAPVLKANDIKISVCLAAHDQAGFLSEALNALAEQTASNFEVIVIDAASKKPAMNDLRQDMAKIFSDKGWRWEVTAHSSLAEAYNYAATLAKGSHLLFRSADCISLPDEIALLMRAAQHGGDIVLSIPGLHPKNGALARAAAFLPTRSGCSFPHLAVKQYFPIGACLNLAFVFATTGDTNPLFRREAFAATGGFEDMEAGLSFRQLLLRAAIQGQKIDIAPEVLMCSRISSHQRNEKERYDDHQMLAQTLGEMVDPSLRLSMQSMLIGSKRRPVRFPTSEMHDVTLPSYYMTGDKTAQDPLRIVFCLDDNYLNPACVMLASIAMNVRGPVELYAVHNLTAKNAARLQEVSDLLELNLTLISQGNLEEYKKISTGDIHNYNSNTTYVRLFLPELLPNIDKILYLDCDLIVRHDLRELWQTELGDYILAAAYDADSRSVPDNVKVFNNKYFNAGVLLISLEKFREHKVKEQALAWVRYFEANPSRIQMWDQTPINIAVGGRFLPLSPTWNSCELHTPYFDRYYGVQFHQMESIIRDPNIYHFLGPEKPWRKSPHSFSTFDKEYQVYERLLALGSRQNVTQLPQKNNDGVVAKKTG